jgi:hypothetical protein
MNEITSKLRNQFKDKVGHSLTGKHRLNMELDLQSLFGLYVHSCSHWLRPPQPPSHRIYEGSYTRTLLVSQEQDRRHLFVTPSM